MSSAFLTNPDNRGFADLMERLSSRFPQDLDDPQPRHSDDRLSALADSLDIDLAANDQDTPETRTLSYESALRRHTRIPSHLPPLPLASQLHCHGAHKDNAADTDLLPPAGSCSDRHTLTRQLLASARESQAAELKRCTISVRLNQEESEVLRLRAAESGMTVSAYLRSCVLEADQLRAQVKNALAELKHSAANQTAGQIPHWQPRQDNLPPGSSPPAPKAFLAWLRRAWALLLGQRSPLRLPVA